MNTLLEELKAGNNNPCGDPFIFNSNKHTRKQAGVSLPTSECNRQIKIEKNINGRIGYSVTIFNTDGVHPLWGNNIQMATKPMKIISVSASHVELRGYGYDEKALNMGVSPQDASFENYGLVIHFSSDSRIVKCTLLLLEREVSIDYC